MWIANFLLPKIGTSYCSMAQIRMLGRNKLLSVGQGPLKTLLQKLVCHLDRRFTASTLHEYLLKGHMSERQWGRINMNILYLPSQNMSLSNKSRRRNPCLPNHVKDLMETNPGMQQRNASCCPKDVAISYEKAKNQPVLN